MAALPSFPQGLRCASAPNSLWKWGQARSAGRLTLRSAAGSTATSLAPRASSASCNERTPTPNSASSWPTAPTGQRARLGCRRPATATTAGAGGDGVHRLDGQVGQVARGDDDQPTPRPANQRTASMTPPSGPSPGHVSARTSRPVAAVSRDRSPPTSTTSAAGSVEHGAHVLDHRLADLDQGLVAPYPPARAAAQHGASRARRLGRQDGGLVGSSWSRNCSQRRFVVLADLRRRPLQAEQRRKPTLVGLAQRT